MQLLDDGVLAHPSVGARDPLKLIVDVSATLADGIAVDRSLNERGIRLEGADRRTLVPLLTIGDDEARVRRLASALAESIDEHRGGLGEAPRIATSWRTLHEQAMTPRQAFFAPRERVRFAEAVGRVSAELIAPYPPGIPALAPGEVVSADLVAALQRRGGRRHAHGGSVGSHPRDTLRSGLDNPGRLAADAAAEGSGVDDHHARPAGGGSRG